MKDIIINTVIRQCLPEELDAEGRELVGKAVAATGSSYAPYSGFHVGAALLLDDSTVVTGANQENASYPVCMCAERSALFNAQSNYPERAVVAIAIAAKNGERLTAEPVAPCGVCRQALLETEQRYHRDIRIYMYGTRCVYIVNSVKDLLPLSFSDEAMK